MIEQVNWIERRFNFDFPVGMFPVIVERLRGTIARIEADTAGISQEIASARIAEKWSVLEQIGHLMDLDDLTEGRIDDFIAGLPALRAADMSNARTNNANYNSRSLSELIQEFRTVRTRLIKRLESLDSDVIARSAMHPRLNQPMRVVDLAYFVAEHDDHHLTKVGQIIKRLA